jgi:LmbE family N-acetylglucosaminyl deacetylase
MGGYFQKNKMNIILSPHFDDAALSLGGLLAQEGKNTLVATFFAGTPPEPLVRKWDVTCGFANSTQAVSERTAEDKKSLNFFGVSDNRIRNYAHLDSQYRLTEGAPPPQEWELDASIAQEITALLQAFADEPLKIFVPGFGIHVDHAVVKRTALAAKALASNKNIEFFFYQDLPYALKILEKERPRTVWNFLTHKNPKHWDYSLLENKVAQGAFTVSPHIIPLTQAEMKKKLAGLEFYTSQVANLDTDLLKRLERFSAAQARFLSLPAPYCEVVYAFN